MTLTPSSSISGGGGGGLVTQGTVPWVVGDGAGSLTVDGPLTDAQLAARLPLSVTGPLTDAQLRALAVAVSGTVALDAATLAALETISVANFPAVQPVSDNGGSLTVDGPLTDAQLRAASVPVSGPLTDAQLRAAVVPVGDGGGSLTVDGTVAVSSLAGTVDVSDRAARLAGVVSGGANVFHVDDNAGSLTVDGTVTANQGTTPWKAREDTAAMTWASVKSAAPAIGAVQATTGALAAGDYDFDIYLMASDTVAVGKGLVVEHRNAADAATLQNLGGCDAPDCIEIRIRRYTLALNERIRVIAGTAAGAAASMYVSAIGRRTS